MTIVKCKLESCINEFDDRSGRKQFCSNKCRCKQTYLNNPTANHESSYAYQKTRATERKIQIIKFKGGACERCGYNKNYAALCFHHIDPTQKDFGIDSRKLSNTKWESLIEEINKCILLCHNCHMEEHYPQCNL